MLNELTFHIGVAVTLTVDALLLGFLVWAHRSPRFAKYRITEKSGVRVPPKVYWRTIATNGVLSILVTLGLIYGVGSLILTVGPTPWYVIALQAAGIFVVYDFTYYWMHRAFHTKTLMRWVHGVHHRARTPSALESLYQSPAELISGLSLLMISTFLVGLASPVHHVAFLAIFFVYSTQNIVIHSGLVFPHPVFAPVNAVTTKHHAHHYDAPRKNYASMSPLPDLIFGTLS
jgi:sterol desaturase/sphingolipid hydroxylase (fatty acid hydroxylase superfamily)